MNENFINDNYCGGCSAGRGLLPPSGPAKRGHLPAEVRRGRDGMIKPEPHSPSVFLLLLSVAATIVICWGLGRLLVVVLRLVKAYAGLIWWKR